MTNRVMKVATIRPPITTVPMETRALAPAPLAMASGIEPMMKAKEVMRIGRIRRRAASWAAFSASSPCRRRSSAKETSRIEFLAANPTRSRRPICPKMSRARPRKASDPTAPKIAIGVASRMTKGRRRDSYCPASSRKIISTPRPKISGAKPPATFSW